MNTCQPLFLLFNVGFIAKSDELKAAGFKEIICVAVNDPFVMDAWGKSMI